MKGSSDLKPKDRVRLIGCRRRGTILSAGAQVSEVQWDQFTKQFHPNYQLKRQVKKKERHK